MHEVINGQIVPAVGQWQATILIIATLTAWFLLRRLWHIARAN